MKKNISVIISCFNEEANIRECLIRVIKAVPQAQVIVVHGGSDNTALFADEMVKTNPNILVIRNKEDRGKGHGIKTGIRHARHEVTLQFDADLQFSPEEIPRVIAPVMDGTVDISFGCRFMPESDVKKYKFSLFRTLGNRIVNRYISLITGQRFYDITTGFKAWSREAIQNINFKDDRFVYEAEIAVRGALKKLRFAMVPVTYYNRLGGISGHGIGFRETMSINVTGAKILILSTLIRLGLW